MAQWSRQFSGHTHVTRVEDLEESLGAAVAALNAAEPASRRQKGKNVRGLAARLRSARRHQLRTQLLAAEGGSAERAQAHQAEIASLRARLGRLDRNGIEDILAEFGLVGGIAG